MVGGYSAPPGTATVSLTTTDMVQRIVARVDATGNVDISTRLSTAFSAGSPRGVASDDGVNLFVCGSTGGVYSIPYGTTGGTQILGTPANMRTCRIFDGQFFGSSASGAFKSVFSVTEPDGSFPSVPGATATLLPGLSTTNTSNYGFVLLDHDPTVAGLDTLYVTDDGVVSAGSTGNPGVQKWTYNGRADQWQLAATYTDGLGTTGARSITAVDNGATVTLIVTTGAPPPNNVIVYVDDGSANPAAHVIATSTAVTVYRGVALAPQ